MSSVGAEPTAARSRHPRRSAAGFTPGTAHRPQKCAFCIKKVCNLCPLSTLSLSQRTCSGRADAAAVTRGRPGVSCGYPVPGHKAQACPEDRYQAGPSFPLQPSAHRPCAHASVSWGIPLQMMQAHAWLPTLIKSTTFIELQNGLGWKGP